MRRPTLRGVAQPDAGRAVLSLYLLAPAVGEMLSGSTPPLMFINPVTLFILCGLYGSGALLAPLVEFAVHPPGRISIGMSEVRSSGLPAWCGSAGARQGRPGE